MDYHPARFIDNNNILILINNIQRNIFRLYIQRLRLRHSNINFVTQTQLVVGFQHLAAAHSTALLQQLLHIRASKLQHCCQTYISTLASLLFSYN